VTRKPSAIVAVRVAQRYREVPPVLVGTRLLKLNLARCSKTRKAEELLNNLSAVLSKLLIRKQRRFCWIDLNQALIGPMGRLTALLLAAARRAEKAAWRNAWWIDRRRLPRNAPANNRWLHCLRRSALMARRAAAEQGEFNTAANESNDEEFVGDWPRPP
jgi:hypothetical protein